jgi:hypothetical protein
MKPKMMLWDNLDRLQKFALEKHSPILISSSQITFRPLRSTPTHPFNSKVLDLPGNTKGGRITVQLTSCLTGLDWPVLQIKQKLSLVIQLNPNQSNRRSTVQEYFPLQYSLDLLNPSLAAWHFNKACK